MKKVAKLINEAHLHGGVKHDLASALLKRQEGAEKPAMKNLRTNSDCKKTDQEIKTNLAAPASDPHRHQYRIKIPRNKGKGKGKGNGKGQQEPKNDKNRRPPASSNNRTLHQEINGKKICFPYNHKKGCTRKDCRMSHVCQICLGDQHGAANCPSA